MTGCSALALCVLAAAVCGCAQPKVLRAPASAPTMARPTQPDPLPAYATPDPHPLATPSQSPAAPP